MQASRVVLVLALYGCQSSQVDPEVRHREEQRLLAPFTQPRAVLGNDVVIECTANFDAEIARPAISPAMHQMTRKKGDGYDEYRYLNKSGGLQFPFRFQIGKTSVTALESAVLRIRTGRSAMALKVEATGLVSVGVDQRVEKPARWLVEDGK
jgi:hypothetical protein